MMRHAMAAWWVSLSAVPAVCYGGVQDSKRLAAAMRLVPAKYQLSFVVVSPAKLNARVAAVGKRFDANYPDDPLLGQLRAELGVIGGWADFESPMAAGFAEGALASPTLLSVRVPDFVRKVSTLAGAKQTDGVWELALGAAAPVYVTVGDEYIVLTRSRDALLSGGADGRTLADAMKGRLELLAGRDLLMHTNFAPIRGQALAGVAQVSQMAPMMAMAMMQQSGGDPTSLTQVLSGLLDGVRAFIQQVDYLDVFLGVGEKAVDATLAAGFLEGGIRNHLRTAKAAQATFSEELADQPPALAVALDASGGGSPMFGKVLDKVFGHMSESPAAGAVRGAGEESGESGAAGAEAAQRKEARQLMRKLYEEIEHVSLVMSSAGGRLRFSGTYRSKDPAGTLDRLSEFLPAPDPLIGPLRSVRYEVLDTQVIGGTTVRRFAIKPAPGHRQGAKLLQLQGPDAALGMGVARGAVRFCFGNDKDMASAFAGLPVKPLSSSRYVKEGLAALPAQRNAVLLVDPAAWLPLLGPMMALPGLDAVPAGPVIAISVTLSGDPARLDVHVPYRAIERVTQVMAPNQPM